MALDGLNRYWNKAKDNHFFLTLLGKRKGETTEDVHILPCVNVTKSKIPVKGIIRRLIRTKKEANCLNGPAISNIKGEMLSVKNIDDMLIEILVHIYDNDRIAFPVDIINEIHIEQEYKHLVMEKYYSCFRTFRRTSDSRALENRNLLHDDDIDIVNRWKTFENANGKRPSQIMRQH